MDDIESIKQLKARYFRTMDGKDWAAYRTVFTDDVLFEARGGLEHLVSAHQGFMPEITLMGNDSATGSGR